MTTIRMDLGGRGYDILVGSGVLRDFCHSADLERKVLILTDDGVPRCYAETVAKSLSLIHI